MSVEICVEKVKCVKVGLSISLMDEHDGCEGSTLHAVLSKLFTLRVTDANTELHGLNSLPCALVFPRGYQQIHSTQDAGSTLFFPVALLSVAPTCLSFYTHQTLHTIREHGYKIVGLIVKLEQ